MNNSELIKQFEKLSLFELWRIQCVIDQLLEAPEKIASIKRALHPGMEISYFEKVINRTITAVVLNVNKTRALVLNKEDGKRWNIPFYMLNLEKVNTNITTTPTQGKYSKINFKVGDNVGWMSPTFGKETFGKIVKLNPKYARVILSDGRLWNVPYNMLIPTLDGNVRRTSGVLIEGEVL